MTSTLLVLNPNATGWMTARVAGQLRTTLPRHVAVEELTAADAPEVIDSAASFEAGAAAAQRALRARLARADAPAGVLLACFGDPGLETLRAAWPSMPVHGLAEAAMRVAAARGLRFAVLTCGPAWVALLKQRAADFGLAGSLGGVYALPVNGLALAREPARWRSKLQAAAQQAEAEGAQALILGGAAFAGLGPLVQTELPVIDAIDAAAQALRAGL